MSTFDTNEVVLVKEKGPVTENGPLFPISQATSFRGSHSGCVIFPHLYHRFKNM